MQTFSVILYNLLKQRGISQRMLAEMAHTTEATISRYLGDAKRMPRIDLVISIAEALNVSTDYLLGLTSIPTRQSLSGEIEELICCYSNANESDKKVIWTVLENTSRQTLKSPLRVRINGILKILLPAKMR